ncbi:flagellar basal body rod protein FlgB [Reinekea thalattae]|uniref:Flagellar basal body rod protein FlgB n=1 Tax=Reinekea thalattae TaxID=2593301 RepID=A0A5C8Z7F9_9GAMM|nr:flagellar basal body rod protein FlgB [Reinekea thalattae]TXR53233.1 flagellar basal body rod protein FlgB [Reinekea thalattae]
MSALGFQNSLGIHDDALMIRSDRSSILANNLANTDTPGYKARDIDFLGVLRGEVKRHKSLGTDLTHDRHIDVPVRENWEALYRNPTQPSIDGNTVDENIENSEFTTNALSYNSSFEFLSGKFKGLTGALRGE